MQRIGRIIQSMGRASARCGWRMTQLLRSVFPGLGTLSFSNSGSVTGIAAVVHLLIASAKLTFHSQSGIYQTPIYRDTRYHRFCADATKTTFLPVAVDTWRSSANSYHYPRQSYQHRG